MAVMSCIAEDSNLGNAHIVDNFRCHNASRSNDRKVIYLDTERNLDKKIT